MSVFDDQYPLDPPEQERLLNGQGECTFIWSTREGWPVGATMAYLWRDRKVWMACGGRRPRVSAVKRNDRVCVVVSDERPNASVTVTVKGRCRVHDDPRTKHWFFEQVARRAFPDNEMARQSMMGMLDTPGRVVLGVTPERSFSFDLAKLFRAAAGAGPSDS